MTFLQYRSAAIAGLTTQFFWGLMMIFIYMALYQNAPNVSMNLEQVIAYTWLHQAFYAFLAVRVMDSEIRDSIRSGNVAYEIIRPYNLYYWWYIKCVAKRVASGMLRVMPVVIIALLLPRPYGLMLPASFTNFILFLVSLILGVLVVSAINMLVHTIGFYTYNEAGISSMLNSVMEFLAGELVPVALLPVFIQKGTYFLPFRLVCDLPFRLYSNNIGISEGLLGLGLQIIWIIILFIIGNVIVKSALKKVFVQGG
jgi:ABC-2 type transport system permease protein